MFLVAIITVAPIGAYDILVYVPVHYPLPPKLFNRIIEIGSVNSNRCDTIDDEAPD